MPFELNIAVKQDPADQVSDRKDKSEAAPCPITGVEVTGDFSRQDAVDLTRRLDGVVSKAPSSVIIRFVDDVRTLSPDPKGIEIVAAWVRQRRRDGCNVYVEADQPEVRDTLSAVEEMKNVMLPTGADASVPRRIVDDPRDDPDAKGHAR